MRIRQITPGWWSDKALHTRLEADEREFYIGLWQLADDAGWLRWDPETIAGELYRYRAVAPRERQVVRFAERLAALDPDAPHLVVYECGHAHVPNLVRYQRFGGRPVYGTRDEHARTCAHLRAASPGSARWRGSARGVPTMRALEQVGDSNVTVGEGTGSSRPSGARAHGRTRGASEAPRAAGSVLAEAESLSERARAVLADPEASDEMRESARALLKVQEEGSKR